MKYDAFISYTDRSYNKQVVEAVSSSLAKIARPWNHRRALRIFTDSESLGGTAALWPSIQDALDNSRYLLVVLSPESCKAEWLNREIRHWLKMHEGDHSNIRLVVVGGELRWNESLGDFENNESSVLPDSLKGIFHDEPWVCFLTELSLMASAERRSFLTLENQVFRSKMLSLASPLHGLEPGQLESKWLTEQRRYLFRRNLSIGIVAALIVALTTVASLAIDGRTEAAQSQSEIEARELSRNANSQRLTDPALALAVAAEAVLASPAHPLEARGALIASRATLLSQPYLALGSPTVGHEGQVRALAVSSRGLIATGGNDGLVVLWDGETFEPVGSPLVGHAGGIQSLAFTPDGTQLASGDRLGTIRLWDALTGSPIGRPLAESGGWTSRMKFGPDGKVLLAANNSEITLWEIQTANPQWAPFEHRGSLFADADLSHDGKMIASAAGKSIRLWDARTGLQLGEDLGSDGVVLYGAVAFSQDSRRLAVSSARNRFEVWDVAEGQLFRTFDLAESGDTSPYTFAFSPDGRQVIAGSSSGSIHVWELETGKRVGTPLVGHQGLVRSLAFSKNGEFLASTGDDGTLRVWLSNAIGRKRHFRIVGTTELSTLAFDPSGHRIAAAGADGHAYVYDLTSRELVSRSQEWHPSSISAMSFSPMDGTLAIASASGTLRTIDPETGETLSPSVELDSEFVSCLAWSPNGTRLAVVDRLGQLKLLSESLEVLAQASHPGGESPDHSCSNAVFSPTSDVVGVDDRSGNINFYSAQSTELQSEQTAGQIVPAFKLDTDALATSSGTKQEWLVQFTNSETGELDYRLLFPESTKQRIDSASPGLLTVVGPTTEQGFQIVDPISGQTLSTPYRDEADSLRPVLSPSSQMIATTNGTTAIRFWDVSESVDDVCDLIADFVEPADVRLNTGLAEPRLDCW